MFPQHTRTHTEYSGKLYRMQVDIEKTWDWSKKNTAELTEKVTETAIQNQRLTKLSTS